jgi:hypothetical protein
MIKHFSALAALMLFTGQAQAVCPPIIGCKPTGEASTIAGSNADQELIMFAQDITKTSNEVAQAIIDAGMASAAAAQAGAQSVTTANMQISQIELNQKLKVDQAMAEQEMAHRGEMAAATIKSRATVLSADDTKEEFELIIDQLTEYSDMSVPEIIVILKQAYDDNPDGKIPIPIYTAEASCTEEDIKEKGMCSVPKKVYPSKKLKAFFAQCTDDKRLLLAKKKEKEALNSAIKIANQSVKKAQQTTDAAGAVAIRMAAQRELACTPKDFKAGLCGGDDPADYQEGILLGNIIPNGDVSSTNFSSPTSSSAQGYIDDLSDEEKAQIERSSLDRSKLKENPNQKVVDLNHTYRNANQVKAAMSYVDNLMAEDLVPALAARDKKKLANAEYQSRHMSRLAALSMARLVMSQSMSERVGDKMRAMLNEGTFATTNKFEITIDSPDNKESVLGAGPLDILVSRVEKGNGSLSGENSDFVTGASSNDNMTKVLDAVQLQKEMLMKEILMNEQMISMSAISLAQKATSPEMLDLMKRLRNGR